MFEEIIKDSFKRFNLSLDKSMYSLREMWIWVKILQSAYCNEMCQQDHKFNRGFALTCWGDAWQLMAQMFWDSLWIEWNWKKKPQKITDLQSRTHIYWLEDMLFPNPNTKSQMWLKVLFK